MIHYPMDTISGTLTGGYWAVNRLASDPLACGPSNALKLNATKQPSLSTTSNDMIFVDFASSGLPGAATGVPDAVP